MSSDHRPSVKSHPSSLLSATNIRHDYRVEIRKDQRNQQIGKRRKGTPTTLSATTTTGAATPSPSPVSLSPGLPDRSKSASPYQGGRGDIQQLEDVFPVPSSEWRSYLEQLLSLSSSPPASRTSLLTSLRTCLQYPSAPLDDMIDAGLMTVLLNEVSSSSSSVINQAESVWCLTNIAADSYRHAVAVLPAAPYLIKMMQNTNELELAVDAAWTIGNLAGDDTAIRDSLMQQGVLDTLTELYQQIHHNMKQSININVTTTTATTITTANSMNDLITACQTITWGICNLLTCPSPPPPCVLCTEFLSCCIEDWTSQQQSVSVEISCILAELTGHGNNITREILQKQPQIVPAMHHIIMTIIRYIKQTNDNHDENQSNDLDMISGPARIIPLSLPSTSTISAVLIPMLRIISSICSAVYDDITFNQLFPSIQEINSCLTLCQLSLHQTHRGVNKLSLITIGVMCARQEANWITAVHSSHLDNDLLRIFLHSPFDIQTEAGISLYHLYAEYTEPMINQLQSQGQEIINAYLQLLRAADLNIIDIVLLALQLLLDHHIDRTFPSRIWLENADGDGLDLLESITQNMSYNTTDRGRDIARRAQLMLDTIWNEKGEDDNDINERNSASVLDVNELPPWRISAQQQSQQYLSSVHQQR